MTNTDAPAVTPDPLVPGSIEAQLLARVWEGSRVTVVKSPPGGGKSTLIAWLVRQLATRTNFSVRVLAPTRNTAADLSRRFTEAGITNHLAMRPKKGDPKPRKTSVYTQVVVSTIARLAHESTACDIAIVDEAWQTTFAELARATSGATQLLLVGDPGQIGPVVRSATGIYSATEGPNLRAPDVFLAEPDTEVFELENTFRLGADGTSLVNRFYDFDFGSRRPERYLIGDTRIPELNQLRISEASSVNSADHLGEVASVVGSVIGTRPVEVDPATGATTTRAITQEDIAVVTSHSSQCDRLASLLASDRYGLPGVRCDTADHLQGGQWPVVIAVDPLVGHHRASTHQLAPGGCASCSRATPPP